MQTKITNEETAKPSINFTRSLHVVGFEFLAEIYNRENYCAVILMPSKDFKLEDERINDKYIENNDTNYDIRIGKRERKDVLNHFDNSGFDEVLIVSPHNANRYSLQDKKMIGKVQTPQDIERYKIANSGNPYFIQLGLIDSRIAANQVSPFEKLIVDEFVNGTEKLPEKFDSSTFEKILSRNTKVN